MILHFNVSGELKKKMVKAVETELSVKAKYLRVPTCAYQIGIFTISKDGALSWDDDNAPENCNEVVSACIRATGITPTEWEGREVITDNLQNSDVALTITMPLNKVNIENLKSLLDAKGELIKKALSVSNLNYTTTKDNISFPWFAEITAEKSHAYTKFISALCEMSVNQKRVTAKPKADENEKYAFRCFLLRLGFIGDEYKEDRKILLKNLNGSSSFKSKKEVFVS